MQVHHRKEAGQPFEELDWEWSLIANPRHGSSPLRKKYQAKLKTGDSYKVCGGNEGGRWWEVREGNGVDHRLFENVTMISNPFYVNFKSFPYQF